MRIHFSRSMSPSTFPRQREVFVYSAHVRNTVAPLRPHLLNGVRAGELIFGAIYDGYQIRSEPAGGMSGGWQGNVESGRLAAEQRSVHGSTIVPGLYRGRKT